MRFSFNACRFSRFRLMTKVILKKDIDKGNK